jgi:hypothetical protein
MKPLKPNSIVRGFISARTACEYAAWTAISMQAKKSKRLTERLRMILPLNSAMVKLRRIIPCAFLPLPAQAYSTQGK